MIIIISIIIINVYLFYFEYLKKSGQTSLISLHTDWQMVYNPGSSGPSCGKQGGKNSPQ